MSSGFLQSRFGAGEITGGVAREPRIRDDWRRTERVRRLLAARSDPDHSSQREAERKVAVAFQSGLREETARAGRGARAAAVAASDDDCDGGGGGDGGGDGDGDGDDEDSSALMTPVMQAVASTSLYSTSARSRRRAGRLRPGGASAAATAAAAEISLCTSGFSSPDSLRDPET